MMNSKSVLFIFVLLTMSDVAHAETPQTCTYVNSNWNVQQKRVVNIRTVSHSYAELTSEEVEPDSGCTVCLEDQMLLKVRNIRPFYVCKKISGLLRAKLEYLLDRGEPVLEVVAYRPGRTKNPLDHFGNRTGFSNHAFGSAVDINRSNNGLYDNCIQFGPNCRLIQGGAWIVNSRGALSSESPIVISMKEAGFKWGGEIAGKQKDFMHFSLSGY